MATVLLVEDDPDQLELRRMIIESAGHRVLSAGNPVQALAQKDPADVAVVDLRLPDITDGISLIQKLQERSPAMKLIVLSGWTRDVPALPANVHQVLQKPVRSKALLQHIARLALLVLFCLAASAETILHLELSAPGKNWEKAGKEAVVADVEVDGVVQQQVMLFAGDQRHRYSVFLGEISPGDHKIDVKGKGIVQHSIISVPADPWVAHAPVLFERKNAIGKFTDVPLLTYVEALTENDQKIFQYTVIFSNEDGGTSTRSLMARWGRTTDIEYVYRAYLKEDGTLDKGIIQSRGHKDIEFTGPFFGTHPMLMPVTDNNMVAGEGPSAVRYQPAPIFVDLSSASRETVMDANPITWIVATSELVREKKLRPFGQEAGETISDPRNYLYIEAKVDPGKAAVAFAVLHGNGRYYYSHQGRPKDAIERAGWIRSTVELPPGSSQKDLRSINALCVYLPKTPSDATCGPTQIKYEFFLTPEKLPGPTFELPIGNN